jgi:hypothetical protein
MSIDGVPGAPASAEDFDFEPEALEALAFAAEALLSEQLAGAQSAALAAGRQEVGPADLRAALRAAGLGHLLPRGTPAAQEEEARERVLPGLLG